jgi:dihydropteroate synthase
MRVNTVQNAQPGRLWLRGQWVVPLPAVMGILNVTPDSFSDGGRYLDEGLAVEHARQMIEAGADIIDVGGESTRPGAHTVAPETEIQRVIPVIRRLSATLNTPISVDTRKAAVAAAALEEGAALVNDVSALEFDPEMAATVARAGASVILMHMRGTPETMRSLTNYRNVVGEVRDYLSSRAEFAIAKGILRSQIILDPGFGFAKTAQQHFELLGGLASLCALGYPVAVGFSRKGLAGRPGPDYLIRNAALEAWAFAHGASIVRVHDPGPTAVVARLAAEIRRAGETNQARSRDA